MVTEPIDTNQLGPISTLPNARQELTTAVDAIAAAEAALCRAHKAIAQDRHALLQTLETGLTKLRSVRLYLMQVRGKPVP